MAAPRITQISALTTACCAQSHIGVRASQRVARAQPAATHSRMISSCRPLQLDFLAPAWMHAPRVPSSSVASQFLSRSIPIAPHACRAVRLSAPRTFSSSSRRSTTATVLLNPRTDDDGNPLGITITPRAAQRLQAIATTDGNSDLALRVTVESGGCHGFQYLMSLTSTTAADTAEDTIFEHVEVVPGKSGAQGDYRAKVIMDEPSLELLKGSSVDYTMELIGSQFKVTGIPGAKSSCGCGTSFDISV